MNDFHSNNELIYKKRWTGSQISSAVKTFPVVVISGARQVGKSTFLQNEFRDFKYVSLDDFLTLKQAKTDPWSLQCRGGWGEYRGFKLSLWTFSSASILAIIFYLKRP